MVHYKILLSIFAVVSKQQVTDFMFTVIRSMLDEFNFQHRDFILFCDCVTVEDHDYTCCFESSVVTVGAVLW